MPFSRSYATAERLSDGRVLVMGGVGGLAQGGIDPTAVLFDPATHTFAGYGTMSTGRLYPTSTVLQNGTLTALKLLTSLNLCTSNGEARRLIEGGGAKTGEDKTAITSHDQAVCVTNGLLVWAGKKKYCRVKLVD